MIFIISIFILIIIVVFASYSKRRNLAPLHVPNWSKDTVYLMQYPVSPNIRSISPFCLKLETWLRLTGISYENVYTRRVSGTIGTVPYIELNGEQFEDSNLIIEKLKLHFGVDPENGLSDEEKASSHAFQTMLEEHTTQIGFWWRYGLNMERFAEVCLENWPRIWAMRWFMPAGMRRKGKLCCWGRWDEETALNFSFKDIKAISGYLGNKKFLHGDTPTTIDCVIFGHLAQFLYIPMEFPQAGYMYMKCEGVVNLVENVRTMYWTDWEEMCAQGCMEGKMSK